MMIQRILPFIFLAGVVATTPRLRNLVLEKVKVLWLERVAMLAALFYLLYKGVKQDETIRKLNAKMTTNQTQFEKYQTTAQEKIDNLNKTIQRLKIDDNVDIDIDEFSTDTETDTDADLENPSKVYKQHLKKLFRNSTATISTTQGDMKFTDYLIKTCFRLSEATKFTYDDHEGSFHITYKTHKWLPFKRIYNLVIPNLSRIKQHYFKLYLDPTLRFKCSHKLQGNIANLDNHSGNGIKISFEPDSIVLETENKLFGKFRANLKAISIFNNPVDKNHAVLIELDHTGKFGPKSGYLSLSEFVNLIKPIKYSPEE